MKTLLSGNSPLTESSIYTYLTSSASSGDSTISVDSIIGFDINQILLIGDWGNEHSEIIKTHATTTPSGTTITLASNLVFDHNPREKVYLISYDQIEISHSNTETGTKTVLATIDIQADQLETQYIDTTQSTGYYFLRWKNTITSTFSDYSSPIPYTGYTSKQVGSIIDYALKRNNLESFTDNIDYDFCISEINACLDYISGKAKKITDFSNFDYILTQLSEGINSVALPDNIYDKEGNKSIYAVRIAGSSPLEWKNKKEFDAEMEGVYHTITTADASAGDTTLTVKSTGDFDDSGTVDVYINGTLYSITYTGKTTTQFTGIPSSGDGSITVTIPSGTNVWYGEEVGEPLYYTVYGGNLYYYPLPDSTYENKNLLLDYYTGVIEVNSLDDEIDLERFGMIKYWLTWAIRSQIKNDGIRDLRDPDFVMFSGMLNDYITKNINSHRKKIYPKINGIFY